MKKTIILTENDLNTLTSGGEVRFGNEDSVEIHVVTEATHNLRKAIAELRDILMRCGAVSVAPDMQEIDPLGRIAEHIYRGVGAIVSVDYNKLAEAAYDHLMGE